MKRFISSVFLLMLSLMAVWAEGTATMSLTNISLKPGEEVTLGIELTNPEDDITGVQCDLYLPQGISIKKDADGEFISQVTDRINTRKPHTLAWAWQSDGAMRLLNYSTTNQLYKGTSGTIIEVVLVADNDLLPGSYDINLKNIVVSHPKGDVIKPANYAGKVTILPAEYTLTYILDDKEFYKEDLSAGSSIIPKEVPHKEGYSFSGWKDLPSTMPTHNVTVKGSYIANKYKVTFVADGKVVSETEMEYGASIVAPEAPAKEGHTFVGWGNIDKTVPAHNATYTAEYKVNSYKLTYEVDGVTYHSEEIAFGTAITPLAAPQKEGKTFSGWSEIPATMPAHDVKVIGSFSSKSYMVKFVVDGKVIYEKSQAYGSKIVVPTVEEKEGYTFSGFGEVDETVPAHDVTYNGSYIANKYKVTFVADGKVVSETEMEYGAPIVAPEAPVKEGHTFVGWGNIDKTVPAHDVVYTAEYKVNSYKLTYEVDGVTYHSEEIAFGTAITPLAAPQKEGKTFSGWSEIPATMPAHDVKVIGSFSSKSYMVKFVVDGKVIYEKSQAYGSKIVVPTVEEKEGYTFSGFGEVDETVPAHDVTYNGSYIANKYKVTFVADGKVVSETEMEYGAPIVAPEAPAKEGYTFVGWGDIDKTVPAHDVVYTAEYKVNIYKLTYILNGNVFAEDSIAYGSIITPREVPDSDKSYFSGWEGLPDIMPAHDVVVYGTTTNAVNTVYNKNQIVTVYSVNGTVVKRNIDKSSLTKLLPPGLYIVAGKKILIK